MIDHNAFFAAADSIGRAKQKPSATGSRGPLARARQWLPSVFAVALFAISASHLPAQTLFTKGPGVNLVGNAPTAMAVADVNGDGKPDVLSAGSYPSSDQLLMMLAGDGTGALSFAWARDLGPFPNGSTFTSIVAGDFHGDGGREILVGYSNSGPLLVATATGPIQGTASGGSDSLALADFNGDGKLDFASVGNTGISVQLGDGQYHFTETFSAAMSHVSQEYLAAGDFNGDGKPDLAVSSSAGLIVLLGDGTGTFTQAPGSPFAAMGTASGNLTVADFNGDGKLDLAWAGTGGVTVLLGDGKGKFTAAPGSPFAADQGSANAPTSPADFNGDGVPDLALGNPANDTVIVLLNDGTGNFTALPPVPSPTLPSFLATGDFNGDGMPDLATGIKILNPAYTGSVTLLLMNKSAVLTPNPRSLTFYARAGEAAPTAIPVAATLPTSGVSYTATANQTWLKPDPASNVTGSASGVSLSADAVSLTAGAYSGMVRFAAPGFFGSAVNVTFKVANPSGTLRAISAPPVGSNPAAVATGDFNQDGKPDLAVANWGANSVTVLLGDGAGGFTAASSPAVGSNPAAVAVGDFNGDGKPDLAVASYNAGQIVVLLGDGTGSFTPVPGPYAGCWPMSVAVGDFNGDGRLDLAAQDAGGPDASPLPIVLLGDGKGHFSGGFGSGGCTVSSGISYPASVAAGDFNGDGKLDLASVRADDRSLTVLLGDGTGNFTVVPAPSLAGSNPGSVAIEDFNGDGKQDIAVGDTVGGIALLLGDGSGNFTTAPASPFLVRFAIRSLAVGDFDGDGTPDLAAADTSNGVTVLLGDETGNFRTPTGSGWFAVGAVNPSLPVFMTAGDFNGDGRPDLAVPANSSNNVLLLLGNPVVTTSTLSTTANPTILYGSAVSLTLTVSNAEPGFSVPSGAVTFYDGATPLGKLNQTTNTYTFNAVNLAPGIHTFSAKYGGNVSSVGSTSSTITIAVILGTSVGPSVSSGTGAASPFNSPGLAQGEMLVSPNGKYVAAMQNDGNFVIYADGKPIWATQTQGRQSSPYRLAVQTDGNLAIYGSSSQDVSLPGFGVCSASSPCIAIWSSGPRGGSAPYTLKMQDDGNLVMYDSMSLPVWYSGTQR